MTDVDPGALLRAADTAAAGSSSSDTPDPPDTPEERLEALIEAGLGGDQARAALEALGLEAPPDDPATRITATVVIPGLGDLIRRRLADLEGGAPPMHETASGRLGDPNVIGYDTAGDGIMLGIRAAGRAFDALGLVEDTLERLLADFAGGDKAAGRDLTAAATTVIIDLRPE